MAQGDGRDGRLVSCLMVTLPVPARFERLKQSLSDYCAQTYPNRELVVVMNRGTDEGRSAVRRLFACLARSDIRLIEAPSPLTLGALRNLSWREACGEVLCQWDDDDLYHPELVERQHTALVETDSLSVCLQEVMQFFPATRRLYHTNWGATPLRAKPGTLMCLKSAPVQYPEVGPDAACGEDLPVLSQLQHLGRFHALRGAPYLNVYVSHGHNTCGDDHRMIADSLGVSQGLLRRDEAALRLGLAPFDFGPGEVVLQGRNGPAFTIDGRPGDRAGIAYEPSTRTDI